MAVKKFLHSPAFGCLVCLASAAIAIMNTKTDEMYAANTWLKTGINEADFLPSTDDGVTYTADGVHPNHAGYALEAAAWLEAIT